MAKLIPKNEATLRAILKIGNATLHDVEAIVGDVAKEAINSLFRCDLIYSVAVEIMLTKGGQKRNMHVYAITEKGRNKLQDADFPKVVEMRQKPKQQTAPALHQMQHFVIPERAPNVKEMMAEIGGREVKITYGVNFAYEPYVPPPDYTRHKPRPIKGIHAL